MRVKKNPFKSGQSVSDDELLAAAAHYGIRTKPQKPPMPAANASADGISNDELLSMASQYGIRPKAQPVESSPVGNAVLGAADWLGGVNSNIQRAGINTDEFLKPARQAATERDNFGFAGRLAASGVALGGLLDTAHNALPAALEAGYSAAVRPLGLQGAVHQMVAPEYSHYEQNIKELPVVSDLRAAAPHAFDQYDAVGQTVMPLPGNVFRGESALAKIGGTALTQGVIGGALAGNQGVQNNGQADPTDILSGVAGGALLGAGFAGGAHALAATKNKGRQTLQGLFEGLKKKQGTNSTMTLQSPSSALSHMKIDPALLDDSEREALAMLQGVPGVEHVGSNKPKPLGPLTDEDALKIIEQTRLGSPAMNSLRGLVGEAAANVPKAARKLSLKEYLTKTKAPEDLHFPDNIDFSTSKPQASPVSVGALADDIVAGAGAGAGINPFKLSGQSLTLQK